MTVRGVRGATTIASDSRHAVLQATEVLVLEMANANRVAPEQIVSVLISTSTDIKSVFPAQAVRSINSWEYVPVLCTHEMDVPGSLPLCIRVLMHVNTDIPQHAIIHVYQRDAVQLRPDLH